jgi:hypothetical protein
VVANEGASDLQILPFDDDNRDRGIPSMWGVRALPRSADSASNVTLCRSRAPHRESQTPPQVATVSAPSVSEIATSIE